MCYNYLSWKSLSYYATIVYIKLCTNPCPYGLVLGDADLLSPLLSLSFTVLGCFPFVRTDRPDHSRSNENFTFNQNFSTRSVKS